MRVRFKGEADDLPCEAFGYVFPVGEWITVHGEAAKLSKNPMFDADADHDGSADPSIEQVRQILDERGVRYHPRAGLAVLLSKLEASNGESA
jgi:hypothetical protein